MNATKPLQALTFTSHYKSSSLILQVNSLISDYSHESSVCMT
ncbi:hypothetical protein PQ478_06325 [Alkalihalophilus pseudofirmus]|nr:hypothetical protein [Alkalihalophilus pseudofirmus]WEG18100.1 hypothetical protein PQ478_06325 [Alkalihalophilus pseudofirmus]